MHLKRIPFNLLVFLGLGLQYSMLHVLSPGPTLVITNLELVIYIAYTVIGLAGFFYKSRRVRSEDVSSMAALFFGVLWTVAITSHFRKESYTEVLTLMNSLGIFTAGLILLTELIILFRA
ncbi:hypothetical protein [Paenibacillus sp. GCM10012306]|uniref:hypothetical protein n=1 Tax=Paenibacillus sp. GCM10012306 TaxID=3317342 RepID=UPI00361A2C4B